MSGSGHDARVDHRRVTSAVASLLKLASEDLPSEPLMARICDALLDLLDVDGAGVMVSRDDHDHFAYAVSDAARDLEKVQETMRFGPCQDAAQTGEPVLAHRAEDLAPWPRLAEVAATFGIVGLAALPLMSRGRCWGVLDLYTTSPDPWDDETLEVAQLLADGITTHLAITADRQEAQLARIQLTHQATHDVLTGLPNRIYLHDRLQDDLDRAVLDGSEVAVLFIDLDDFGLVNRAHGRRAGDQVLVEVAHRLLSLRGPGDLAARLDNDTFVLVHVGPGDTDLGDGARDLATRVQQAVAQPVTLGADTVTLTAHVGAGVCGGGLRAEDLVDEADHAWSSDPGERDRPVRVRRIQAPGRRAPGVRQIDLSRALERDALTVHFQDVVEAAAPHRTTAAEALMRWRTPDGTVVPASSFIETATRHGLMPSFGAWVLNRVCEQVRQWDDLLGDASPERVFVNLSARELNDPALPSTLAAALDRRGLAPGRLGLEIVEEAFVHHGLVRRVAELRARGHLIAVDDFGTGHSTLARLTQLDADVVKLDRSLVVALARDQKRADFIRAVVGLTRALGAEVVAEGVETVEQRDVLRDAGVDRLQGYLFGRPASAEALTRRLLHPDPTVLVRHRRSGQAAVVGPTTLVTAVRRWFPDPSATERHALDRLGVVLDGGRPARELEDELGLEISRLR